VYSQTMMPLDVEQMWWNHDDGSEDGGSGRWGEVKTAGSFPC
jgi:hypothetical protein